MAPLIVALFSLALILFWLSARGRQGTGLPSGRVFYVDTNTWGPVEKPLYDPVLALTGRPDYLVKEKGRIIPVEVKSGRSPYEPFDEHVFQLAAYCLLVQRVYGKRPPYGILHYPERTFAVDFTLELESALHHLMAEIREQDRRREVDRSHDSPARCQKCGFRSLCDQKL